MPVVLASRTGSGEVLSRTYRYPGSEIELLELGVVRAGALDGLKARVLLSLCLAAHFPQRQIATAFETIGRRSRMGRSHTPDQIDPCGQPPRVCDVHRMA
jgi:L-asparaginase